MWLNIGIGCILGFLAGLGVGGGSLLILWLTLVLDMDPLTARSINLMFFIPCALCSSAFRIKQGDLPIKKLLLPMMLGGITAAGTSLIGPHLNAELLKKLFGILLLLTGIREVFYRPK